LLQVLVVCHVGIDGVPDDFSRLFAEFLRPLAVFILDKWDFLLLTTLRVSTVIIALEILEAMDLHATSV